MKIWQRYLFKQISLLFVFILFALFSIYLMIDLSVHSVRISHGSHQAADWTLFYLHRFSTLYELFVPLAFLLSILKVLHDLNSNLELLSLQMAQISMKRLLMPFFLFATLLAGIGYANSEWIAPQSLTALKKFKQVDAKKKTANVDRIDLQTMILSDGSELVYHDYDEEKQELSDVFWIQSDDSIWHSKTLSFKTYPPTAYFVDLLTGNNGKFSKTKSFDQIPLPNMLLQVDLSPAVSSALEERSISALFQARNKPSNRQAGIQTHLYHKLTMPLLPFLILFAIAPFTIVHDRNKPIFLIVSLSLLGFIVIVTLFDGFLILGEHHILAPWIAIWITPALLLSFSLRRFIKV